VGLSNSKLLCNKTKLNQNSVTEMHRNKKSLQKRVKPLSKVGKKLAGVTVHGVERLCSNKLEDVLSSSALYFVTLRVAANSATALVEAVADYR